MRAKIRPLARGLTALAAVGAAIVVMSAGSPTATAARMPHAAHVADTAPVQNVVASPIDWNWS
jgi:hypothetical protein